MSPQKCMCSLHHRFRRWMWGLNNNLPPWDDDGGGGGKRNSAPHDWRREMCKQVGVWMPKYLPLWLNKKLLIVFYHFLGIIISLTMKYTIPFGLFCLYHLSSLLWVTNIIFQISMKKENQGIFLFFSRVHY